MSFTKFLIMSESIFHVHIPTAIRGTIFLSANLAKVEILGLLKHVSLDGNTREKFGYPFGYPIWLPFLCHYPSR